ncbi:MAG: helix-turn-helix transcriptional regulator [Ruminococcus sp.]|nr:helix-turn-helix transcriptional regulator [Ruminococcus sp.]
MTEHQLFPDISLIFSEAPGGEPSAGPGALEIYYCTKGRREFTIGQQCYYLTEGIALIRKAPGGESGGSFPTGEYAGLKLVIGSAAEGSGYLEGVDLRASALMGSSQAEDCLMIRPEGALLGAFTELAGAEPDAPAGWLRLKAVELLMTLSNSPLTSCAKDHRCPADQVTCAKKACRWACASLNEHFTIAELSQVSGLASTRLKAAFRMVYGSSVYSYIRRRKMLAAGRLLRETDRTVLDIAVEVGYFNGSKFAKAFKEEIGLSPREYRASSSDQMEPSAVQKAV